MANSLLAHMYSYIKGSQEDIATISLQYILSQSSELNKIFTSHITDNLSVVIDSDIQYTCQLSGKEKERPDMSGIDSLGIEQVLCEMKFYAGLTKNQPNTYLERLKRNNGKGLVFICPRQRMLSLWAKLKEECKGKNLEYIKEFCVSVDGIHMAIISWTEILEILHKYASTLSPECISDIQQLEGYCAQMDSDAFIPFAQEDLTAERARLEERYYEVIDETINLLCADDSITTSTKGLKASAYRHGYTRSLYIDDLAITFNYDRNQWKSNESIETPFWVAVRESDWSQTERIKEVTKKVPDIKKGNQWSMIFIGLEPLINATLLEVTENLKNQILEYIRMVR